MPYKPKHPCTAGNCPELIESSERYCTAHKKQEQKRYDSERGTSTERGYGARWQRYRKSYLRTHPLCVECMQERKIVPSMVVDHIKPHHGDDVLFWARENHQALCKKCHDRKTAKLDGRWGGGIKSLGELAL